MEITPIPYEKNAKKHSKEQLYKLAVSIRDFGWRQPIVVDSQGVIIVGHGRWFAWERYKDEMGLLEPRVEMASDLSEDKVRAYRLADNFTSSQEYDMEMVENEMEQVPLLLRDFWQQDIFSVIDKPKDDLDVKAINKAGMEAYLNNSIRQVVLHYKQSDFQELLPKCDSLGKLLGCETNSDLFKKPVEEKHAGITLN